MRVFVTGGTGAIGSHAVPALIEMGHVVTALARTEPKAAALRAQGATAVTVSLFDPDALANAFAGHDAVVNLASALPSTWRFMSSRAWANNTRVRTEGSAAVVDAAITAGVERVVQESVSMIYPDRGSDWIDEDVPPDDFPTAGANLAAEASAARFSRASGTAVVLRLGWFYGPRATHSEEFLRLSRRGLCITLGRPDGYVSSIHMLDAGAAVAAALGCAGGTYNIVDDEPLTKRDYADALAHATHRSRYVRVPGRVARLFGNRTTSLTRSLRVSNRRFKAATGWAPRFPSAVEGWAATAAMLSHPRPDPEPKGRRTA